MMRDKPFSQEEVMDNSDDDAPYEDDSYVEDNPRKKTPEIESQNYLKSRGKMIITPESAQHRPTTVKKPESSYPRPTTKSVPEPESPSPTTKENSIVKSLSLLYSPYRRLIGLSILAILGLMAYSNFYRTEESKHYRCLVKEDDFPEQGRDFWKLCNVTHQRNSNSVLLLHSPENRDIVHCLAKKLAESFSIERNANKTKILTPSDLKSEGDYGILLDRYRYNGLVIVHNLDYVEAESAQMFHPLCDDVTIANSPSLYIFTIEAKLENGVSHKLTARKILENAWSSLPSNVLSPLLSRILGFIYVIKPEHRNPCYSDE